MRSKCERHGGENEREISSVHSIRGLLLGEVRGGVRGSVTYHDNGLL